MERGFQRCPFSPVMYRPYVRGWFDRVGRRHLRRGEGREEGTNVRRLRPSISCREAGVRLRKGMRNPCAFEFPSGPLDQQGIREKMRNPAGTATGPLTERWGGWSNLLILLWRFSFVGFGFLFHLLAGGDAPAPAILPLGHSRHLLSFVSVAFTAWARLHPQMHRCAKPRGSLYSWNLFSAILTIRSCSFFFPS